MSKTYAEEILKRENNRTLFARMESRGMNPDSLCQLHRDDLIAVISHSENFTVGDKLRILTIHRRACPPNGDHSPL